MFTKNVFVFQCKLSRKHCNLLIPSLSSSFNCKSSEGKTISLIANMHLDDEDVGKKKSQHAKKNETRAAQFENSDWEEKEIKNETKAERNKINFKKKSTYIERSGSGPFFIVTKNGESLCAPSIKQQLFQVVRETVVIPNNTPILCEQCFEHFVCQSVGMRRLFLENHQIYNMIIWIELPKSKQVPLSHFYPLSLTKKHALLPVTLTTRTRRSGAS